MKTGKRILSLALALVLLSTLALVPHRAQAAVQDLSASVRFAESWQDYSGSLAQNTPKVMTDTFQLGMATQFMLHSGIPFEQGLMKCLCGAGKDCAVMAGMKAADIAVRYTENGDMLKLTFADVEKSWAGETHSTVYATAIPTDAAVSGATVRGVFTAEKDGHVSESFPFAFTLAGGGGALEAVVSTDTSVAGAFNGGSPVVNAELTAAQEMSVALCTTYFTGGNYTEEKPIEATFTAGEGFVTLTGFNTGHGEIWGGTACTYLIIRPTDAGKAITEDAQITGTMQVVQNGGAIKHIPFNITLKKVSAFHEWGVADGWTERAIQILNPVIPQALTHTFALADTTEGYKTLLHSSYHMTACACGQSGCPELEKAENLKVRLDTGADMAEFRFEKAYYDPWGQDCVFMTVVPTDTAKASVRGGNIAVGGAFYYENGAHRSADYHFTFTFRNSNPIEGLEDLSKTAVFGTKWQNLSKAQAAVLKTSFSLGTVTQFMLHSDAAFTGKILPCTCGLGTECPEVASFQAADLKWEFTANGDMLKLSFADVQKEWGGESHACVYGTAVPTDCAVAGAQVTGSFRYEKGEHKTGAFPFAFTLLGAGDAVPVVSTDASVAGAFSNGNPTLNTELTVAQELSVAMCTTYFTGDNYNTAQAVEAEYTAGEGLITLEGVNAGHSEIWGGTQCTYLVIKATAAGRAIAEDTAVTGTLKIVQNGGAIKSIPFTVTLKKVSSFQEWGVADAWTNRAIVLRDGGEEPIEFTFDLRDGTTGYHALLHSSYHLMTCTCGKDGCAVLNDPENIRVSFTAGGEYADFRFEKLYYADWSQECVFMNLLPTEAAKNAVRDGDLEISGSFRYASEDGNHSSGSYPFTFTLRNANNDPVIVPMTKMVDQVNNAVAAIISGKDTIPKVHEIITADATYRGLFMRTAMLEFLPCEQHGVRCPTVLSYGGENLKVKVKTNAGLANVTAEVAQYDGAGWGDCFYITVTPTEAAQKAAPGTYVSGVFYFEKNGHTTREIPFFFSFEKENLPKEIINLEGITDQADKVIQGLRAESVITPIHAALQYGERYRGRIMRMAMVPYVPCGTDGKYCSMVNQFTGADVVVNVTANEELATFQVEQASHDGAAWGQCIYLNVQLTAKAAGVEPGTAITGELFFRKAGHETRPIPFVFFVGREDPNQIHAYDVPKAELSIISMEGFADKVNDYIIACRTGARLDPVKHVVDPTKKQVAIIMTNEMIPFVLCEVDGIHCPESTNFRADDMVAEFQLNGDMIKDIYFETGNYDAWGNCVYMFVEFSDTAVAAPAGTEISGRLYFQRNGHKTQDIQVTFCLREDLSRPEDDTHVVDDPMNFGPTTTTTTTIKNESSVPVLVIVLAAVAVVLLAVLVVFLLRLKSKKGKAE